MTAGAGRRPTSANFLLWAFIVGIAIAAFVIFLSLQVTRGFAETAALRGDVIRSFEDRAELQRLRSLHQDLEIGQRGYVLTGNPSFLAPYEAADRRINGSLDRLAAHSPGGSRGPDRIAELERLSEAKRAFVARTIGAAQSGDRAEAQAMIAGGEGKRLMDAIRRVIDVLEANEAAQLEQRTGAAENARTNLRTKIVVLQVLLILALGTALALLVRAYKGWQITLSRERDLTARQQAIFESARDGMIIMNASGSIESLNPAAARMFGYRADELLRRDVGMLFEVAPDRGRIETFLKRLASSKAEGTGDVQDLAARCKDGSIFPAAVSVSPVAFGDQIRFLAVLRDVTERIQVDRMKSEFVSTVSHELRTPLTSISGSLGLIAGGAAGALPERAQRLVEIAQSNCARLIRLINDILDIEKIESGKMRFEIKPLPLASALEHAVDANAEFASGFSVDIELGPVPEGARILADEDRAMQVFTNLLSNAAKFSPAGGKVRVSVTPLDRRFRISIADDGPGISEEFRGRIFSKFAQADSSDTRTKGGTGLGLSIVREIVERLGGAVSFESEPGEGTTFHVDLPAAPDDQHVRAPVEELGRISAGELPLVLHVDDDPDMLRVVASAFEGTAQVHSSPSVVEGEAALRRYDFDAIILDVAMADGSGLDLIPLIRRRQKAHVIVFTAQDADPKDASDADLVLTKSRDSLDRLVAEVVERLGGRQQGEP